MSTPPPSSPWDQPQVPQEPGQPQAPTPPPAGPAAGQAPPAAPTVPVTATPGGGGSNKKGMWIGLGVLAVAVLGVVGFLAVRGGDDDASDGNRDRDRREERDRDRTEASDDSTDRDERSDAEGDPEDAVGEGRDFVQALIDGECAGAAVRATDDFIDTVNEICGGAPDGTEVTDASLDSEDPVVVVVSTTSDEGDDALPLEMVYEDDNWLVAGFYVAEPADDFPTDDTIEVPGTSVSDPDDGDAIPTAGDDPEQMAEQAIQAVIDGDCDAALALATIAFAANYEEEICSGELLPPDATITGVEMTSAAPVVVSVDVDVDGEPISINLIFAEEFGALLIADYGVS